MHNPHRPCPEGALGVGEGVAGMTIPGSGLAERPSAGEGRVIPGSGLAERPEGKGTAIPGSEFGDGEGEGEDGLELEPEPPESARGLEEEFEVALGGAAIAMLDIRNSCVPVLSRTKVIAKPIVAAVLASANLNIDRASSRV
jgi:hypothetical protein